MYEVVAEEYSPGDMVKVRFRLQAPDYDKWPSIRRKIEQWAARIKVDLDSVLPVPRIEENQAVDEPLKKKRSTSGTSGTLETDPAIMKAYCERYRVGDKTLRLGLKLMEKANVS